jgi:hypothetical protein
LGFFVLDLLVLVVVVVGLVVVLDEPGAAAPPLELALRACASRVTRREGRVAPAG